jgi:hypothetical protein
MTRKLPAVLGAAWLLIAGAAMAQLYPPVTPFTPAGQEQTAIVLLPSGTPGGATELDYIADCLDLSPREGIIAFSWTRGERLGNAQRIDVSKLREGFDTNRFDSSPSLAADLRAVSLQNPEPGVYYYWRVLSETPSGWIASPVARFEAPICPSDGPAFDRSGSGE